MSIDDHELSPIGEKIRNPKQSQNTNLQFTQTFNAASHLVLLFVFPAVANFSRASDFVLGISLSAAIDCQGEGPLL
jgi:hypothetical protein